MHINFTMKKGGSMTKASPEETADDVFAQVVSGQRFGEWDAVINSY